MEDAQVGPSGTGLRACRVKEDRPPLHLSERVCSQTPAQRPSIPSGSRHLQGGPSHLDRAGQGQEPLAQRGLPLGRAAAVLRVEGDELLHRHVRSVARARCARSARVVPGARTPYRAAQIAQYGAARQTAGQVILSYN